MGQLLYQTELRAQRSIFTVVSVSTALEDPGELNNVGACP
jgi:hypothetical protein